MVQFRDDGGLGGDKPVQPSPRAILHLGNLWVLPPTLKISLLLESPERTVQSTMCSEAMSLRQILDFFGQAEAVEFVDALMPKAQNSQQDLLLDGNQCALLSSHDLLCAHMLT